MGGCSLFSNIDEYLLLLGIIVSIESLHWIEHKESEDEYSDENERSNNSHPWTSRECSSAWINLRERGGNQWMRDTSKYSPSIRSSSSSSHPYYSYHSLVHRLVPVSHRQSHSIPSSYSLEFHGMTLQFVCLSYLRRREPVNPNSSMRKRRQSSFRGNRLTSVEPILLLLTPAMDGHFNLHS